ncbi:YhcU family protein [Neobacillus sp. FSL H8-0543]|uniref:YhcU family protein n=1 Tax=Neobacillus sp. FSL H8-0543 TaxID=2954672 RepID=UPI003157FEEB
MKIVFASTPSQEEEICVLVRYIYSKVFPLYFIDEEINEFEQLKVLHFTEDFNTLKDAFQVMASLQTLISILESPTLYDHYAALFNKNVTLLEEFGLSFPFEFQQFIEAKHLKCSMLSIYTKADNELLV